MYYQTMYYETISETVDAYDLHLNEVHETVELLGVEYYASELLKSADPIAYKCGWIDWCDAEGIDTDDLEDDYTFDRDR